MKLGRLLTLIGLAGGAYKAYQHRQTISALVTSTTKDMQDGQKTVNHIKEQVTDLQDQTQALSKLSEDLTYKVRVFQQESQPHLKAITAILDKYSNKDKTK